MLQECALWALKKGTIIKMTWQARRWQPRILHGGLLGATARYSPALDQVKTKAPRPGTFYRARKGIYPATVAKVAYKDQGVMGTPSGLKLMNDSTWNRHIRYAASGYSAYSNIPEGMQFDPKYNVNDPLSVYGSGHAYPVVWVPPADGREPEEYFGWIAPPTDPGEPATPDAPGPMGPQGPPGQIGPPGPRG